MKNHLHISKPTILAIAFFFVMTLVGISAVHAQNDTVSPLLSTTGPNVLGEGRIQWNTTLQWDYLQYTYISNSNYYRKYNGLGANTGLRFGIGSRTELTLGVEAFHYIYKTNRDKSGGVDAVDVGDQINANLAPDNMCVAPSVGTRLLLYEGKGWLPKVTFNTAVAMAAVHGRMWADDEVLVQPTIGLSFRNDLGKGWMLDYALDFTWNRHYPIQNYPPATFSLFARWLATDRLLLGAGFSTATWTEPFIGAFEVRYLVSPDLQLTMQGGVSGGGRLGIWSGSVQTHALAGVSWMIK